MVKKSIILGRKVFTRGRGGKTKINVIKNLPLPILVKVIKSFLGHTRFYHCCIKEFSKIAHPLCKLLEKEVKLQFDRKCFTTLGYLKAKLISPPIIMTPGWSELFEMMCNKSRVALV